jgi:putative Holliday junction resolvase
MPPTSQDVSSGRIAAIDYGTVRIGIAISDPQRSIASPYENYTRRGPQADAKRFQRLVAEEDIKLFVVGLPVHLSGLESQKSLEARRFGQWLAEATGVPVEFFDERYTTSEAEQFLIGFDVPRKKRKALLDKLAAQILLTAYLESHTKGAEPPKGLDE